MKTTFQTLNLRRLVTTAGVGALMFAVVSTGNVYAKEKPDKGDKICLKAKAKIASLRKAKRAARKLKNPNKKRRTLKAIRKSLKNARQQRGEFC